MADVFAAARALSIADPASSALLAERLHALADASSNGAGDDLRALADVLGAAARLTTQPTMAMQWERSANEPGDALAYARQLRDMADLFDRARRR